MKNLATTLPAVGALMFLAAPAMAEWETDGTAGMGWSQPAGANAWNASGKLLDRLGDDSHNGSDIDNLLRAHAKIYAQKPAPKPVVRRGHKPVKKRAAAPSTRASSLPLGAKMGIEANIAPRVCPSTGLFVSVPIKRAPRASKIRLPKKQTRSVEPLVGAGFD